MKLFKFLAVFLAIVPILAQTPDVDVVLDKAGDYVATYERTFVGVVAEETYRQEVRGAAGADPRGFPAEARSQRRDLKSDMLLVRAPAGQQQVDDISAASARYKIGGVNRNVNLPVLALTVLEPQNRAWFSFKAGKKTGNLFDLEFREERSGTLIRMREKYALNGGTTIEGKATYARFRRYQVVVNETVK